MKEAILITGVAGSGKSTVCRELIKQGYEAYDIEEYPGLFAMVDKETGLPFEDQISNEIEKIKNGDWVCDKNKLEGLIGQQGSEKAFYCGTASNIDDIWPVFNKVFLLKTRPKTLNERLSSRKKDEFGGSAEVRDWILSWKDWWEEKITDKGAIIINANRSLHEAAEDIIDKITS